MDAAVDALLGVLALPAVGLGALFVVAFLSATLLPLGSEPALYALVRLEPASFWAPLLVATLGNTLGGALTWWMGRAARRAFDAKPAPGPAPSALRHGASDARGLSGTPNPRALRWLERWGPPACALAWLPVVGDPLCAVAGWLRLPIVPCVAWMALGKFCRYVVIAAGARSLAVAPA